ncbi:putative MFS-type transporter SLC18B1 [Hypsibius exemplaris]|uniref:MFS-type transporter SLC18B1 n=1 Tax=Hypsibius exemplaris TaxID=2072580 RepID=A0A1W0XEB1_HYPEX|nr:putative MFS-type transporter SLC18B1 [Hypsibius exemplaris]
MSGSRRFSRSFSQIQVDDRQALFQVQEKRPDRTTSTSTHILPVVAALRSFTRHEAHIIAICSVAVLIANIAVGTMPLLIPIEIMRKGYLYSWIGILFLVYGVIVFLCELLHSKIVPAIGTKRTFIISCVVLGICDISFGLLRFTTNGNVFGGVGCLIRVVEGFCYAGLMNSAFTILCLTIPDKAILGIGLIDGLIGLGYALGPLIAGALYSVADFTLPFALMGILIILVAIWAYFGLPHVSGELALPGFGDVKMLYTDLAFIASVVITLAMGIVVGFLEATLEVYLNQFHKGVVAEGTIFFIGWTAAAVSSPLWGVILARYRVNRTLLLLGPVVEAIIFIFFGSFPGMRHLMVHLGLSVLCLILLTVGTAMSLMAAVDMMIRRASHYGLANDIVTYAFISAIWLATLYLGEGLGGIVSGTVLDFYSYDAVTVSLIIIEVILGVVAAAILYVDYRRTGLSLPELPSEHSLSGPNKSEYIRLP